MMQYRSRYIRGIVGFPGEMLPVVYISPRYVTVSTVNKKGPEPYGPSFSFMSRDPLIL
jgi:hypothetical protein